MLKNREIEQMRKNAKIHKKIFEEIKKIALPWTKAKQVDKLCYEIAKKNNVLCAFKWAYWFPDNICISINDEIAHWRWARDIIFKNWDLVNFDFWIKDKGLWINTDTWFSLIIWWNKYNSVWAKMIEVNKKALEAWIKMCKPWNKIWDISAAIEKEILSWWFKVVKDLTGHSVWKKIHEKPYIPNYGKAGTWETLKPWMVLAIEPLLWETSWEIIDKGWYEIYIKDGSLGCQFENNVLITKDGHEIII